MTCKTFLWHATALFYLLVAKESSALPATDQGPILNLGYAKYQGVTNSTLGYVGARSETGFKQLASSREPS